jgi:radical SAM superfamily enzyme YgiQ (UPF0313 family)
MRLYLINPFNPLVSITKGGYWNQYRVWKPLGLLVVAGLTPPEWEISVFDENVEAPDYSVLPLPDLVGVTAFTSQAPRAYELAAEFRSRGVPVVMGGIHASMCPEEARKHVDAVVTGEAEDAWGQVLEDVQRGGLKPVYQGTFVEMDKIPPARHDLLSSGYRIGSIQTTRGCPLNCTFCSVTAFNGRRYRHRPIDHVVREMKQIEEKYVLVVDDNLFGTRKDHMARSKGLFRAMIDAKLGKRWMCQATVNMADDEEMLELAAKSGCFGVFIGFETTTEEGLTEIHKKINCREGRDLKASVQRIQRHGIVVLGAFVMGLDVDRAGVGSQIADTANHYGVAALNVLFLTPLPGTELWDTLDGEGRILSKSFPADWQYYTLSHPVASYKHLSWTDIVHELCASYRCFYSLPRIAVRMLAIAWRTRKLTCVLAALVMNVSYRLNLRNDLETYRNMALSHGDALETKTVKALPCEPLLNTGSHRQDPSTTTPAPAKN